MTRDGYEQHGGPRPPPGRSRMTSLVGWRWARALVVVAGGLGLAIVVANTVATPMEGDVGSVVATAFGAALVPGVLGAIVLWLLRARSVQTQAIVVALVSVAGTAAGVLVASASMFLSVHDRDVLVVVLIAAGTVGVVAALWLGERVGRATRSLAEMTRRIGVGEAGAGTASASPAPEEFARLARELDDREKGECPGDRAREIEAPIRGPSAAREPRREKRAHGE